VGCVGACFVLLVLPAFLPSVIFSFFAQNEGAGESGASPRSALQLHCCLLHREN